MKCPTCGSEASVHGDCLVCNSPLRAPASAVAVADHEDAQGVIARLAGRFPAAAVEAHVRLLPASYLRRTPASVIGDHIALIADAAGGTAITHSGDAQNDALTIATSDRPGILATVAGVLAFRRVNILGGTAYTRDDGIAIDVIRVAGPAERAQDKPWWDEVCGDVGSALAGELEVSALAPTIETARTRGITIPTSVYVDLDSGNYTKVEVNAADRVGLLYAITRALHSVGVDIHLADVETSGLMGVDTFYVRRADGEAIDREFADALQARVSEAIAALG
jgi:[protein-PII] uridylyltransferase